MQKNKFITVRFMLHTVVIGGMVLNDLSRFMLDLVHMKACELRIIIIMPFSGFMLFMLPFISGRIAFYKRYLDMIYALPPPTNVRV